MSANNFYENIQVWIESYRELSKFVAKKRATNTKCQNQFFNQLLALLTHQFLGVDLFSCLRDNVSIPFQ